MRTAAWLSIISAIALFAYLILLVGMHAVTFLCAHITMCVRGACQNRIQEMPTLQQRRRT